VVESLAKRIQAEAGEEALQPWLTALACLSKPSNVQGLEELLLDDPRPPVQKAVSLALGGIGDSRACWLLATCGVDLPPCREALAQVRSPYAQAALQEIASSTLSADVRAAARDALDHYER
jgi:hypothetical protein